MKKAVFAIRTHKFSDREKYLYDYAVNYFGKTNTFIACNNDVEDIKISARKASRRATKLDEFEFEDVKNEQKIEFDGR